MGKIQNLTVFGDFNTSTLINTIALEKEIGIYYPKENHSAVMIVIQHAVIWLLQNRNKEDFFGAYHPKHTQLGEFVVKQCSLSKRPLLITHTSLPLFTITTAAKQMQMIIVKEIRDASKGIDLHQIQSVRGWGGLAPGKWDVCIKFYPGVNHE